MKNMFAVKKRKNWLNDMLFFFNRKNNKTRVDSFAGIDEFSWYNHQVEIPTET